MAYFLWVSVVSRVVYIICVFLLRGIVPGGWVAKLLLFPFFVIYLTRSALCRDYFSKALKRAFESCGPVFVKIGQSISLKPYLFSERVVSALASLQDDVSPVKMPLEEALPLGFLGRVRVLNGGRPVASGSVAQVYKGIVVETGECVAVKVVKPNIRKVIDRDVLCISVVASLLDRFPRFKRFKLNKIVQNVHKQLGEEQDLRVELANLIRIKRNTILDPNTHVPLPVERLCSSNVLVTKWAEGQPVLRSDKVLPAQRRKIVENFVSSYMSQVYLDGVFHADLHPGNIFVNDDLSLTLLDFGILGRLSELDRLAILDILKGFVYQDYDLVVEAHVRANYIPQSVDVEEFRNDLMELGVILSPGSSGAGVDGLKSSDGTGFSMSNFLLALFKIMDEHRVEVQEQLLMLYKTILFVEAVSNKIDPTVDVWGVASAWLRRNMYKITLRRLGLSALLKGVLNAVLDLIPVPHR